MMNSLARYCSLSAVLALTALASAGAQTKPLRPPSVPLVAHDPYFSIWSPADHLTDVDTTHWTGKPNRLGSVVQVDGKAFRVMGKEPASVPALPQTGVDVLPTRTIYTFAGEGVKLTLTFLTPALADDLEILARPVTYLTYEIQATDGKEHEVSFEFTANGELTVNQGKDLAVASLQPMGKLTALKVGSQAQAVLAKRGDDIRINWGYLYLAAQPGVATGSLNVKADEAVAAETLQATLTFAPLKVSARPASRWLMIAYDDLQSIQFMKKNLQPYWRRKGDDAAALLKKAAADYLALQRRCAKFDAELIADLRAAGGEHYAQLACLAYRHCFAAGKFVADANGQPISFCKENHSNGCIGTSDVFYPMAPQFLLFGPTLAKSFLVPFMDYASSGYWRFPFAPHDLGTYPQANGQVYGGGERTEENQMPVEESGNLLILITAVAQMEGNADFAGRYWKTLTQWAEYLKAKGFDPENQLCTDDFAGHLAHNVNLSAKAIVGLGCYAKLCALRGDQTTAAAYLKLAQEFAARWVKEADDGEKFRLAFDKPGTWSQKYNIAWDRILGLNLFPAEVATKEMAYYRKIQKEYGLPLDNRKEYTKLDWITWTATLTGKREDFEALVAPVIKFLNETPDRSPMTDWYFADTAKKRGFTARPVVGGVFLQMLCDHARWKKWAKRERTKAANWAPMPLRPKVTTVMPAANQSPRTWRYTTAQPSEDWAKPGFDDSAWSEGKSGFGTKGRRRCVINTEWNTSDIWLRCEVDLPVAGAKELQAWLYHDDGAEVYLNGVLAVSNGGAIGSYETFPMSEAALATLKPAKNVIAVHCHEDGGGAYIDLGLVKLEPADAAR